MTSKTARKDTGHGNAVQCFFPMRHFNNRPFAICSPKYATLE